MSNVGAGNELRSSGRAASALDCELSLSGSVSLIYFLFLFQWHTEFNSRCLHEHGCGIIYWKMENLPVATKLQKNGSAFPTSY